MKETRITLNLPDAEALALAQLVKRITWSHVEEMSIGDTETRQILSAIEHLRQALAEASFQPALKNNNPAPPLQQRRGQKPAAHATNSRISTRGKARTKVT